MAEMIRCDHCGTSLRLPQGFAGREVRCPSCQEVFTARPTDEPAPLTPPLPPEESSPITPSLPPDEPLPRRAPRDPVDEEEEARLERRRRTYERARLGEMRVLPHRGGTILALGIGSIVLFCFTGIAIGMGVAAIVMGSIDLGKMRNEQMDPSGKALTVAGQVCGVIGVIVGILSIFAFCALGGLGNMK